jgi:hypothetical protein
VAGINRGTREKVKIPKNDISSLLTYFYLSSHGLVEKTPDSHTEKWGSNPAGGNKVLHILPQF